MKTTLYKVREMRFFTICAENYFGQALTTVKSLQALSATRIDVDIWVLDDSLPIDVNQSYRVLLTLDT